MGGGGSSGGRVGGGSSGRRVGGGGRQGVEWERRVVRG